MAIGRMFLWSVILGSILGIAGMQCHLLMEQRKQGSIIDEKFVESSPIWDEDFRLRTNGRDDRTYVVTWEELKATKEFDGGFYTGVEPTNQEREFPTILEAIDFVREDRVSRAKYGWLIFSRHMKVVWPREK